MKYVCKECGNEYTDEICFDDGIGGTHYGICDDCLYDYADTRKCYTICKNEESEQLVKLNTFLWYMFSQDEIEEILLRELETANDVSCRGFVDDDKEWFREKVEKYEGTY